MTEPVIAIIYVLCVILIFVGFKLSQLIHEQTKLCRIQRMKLIQELRLSDEQKEALAKQGWAVSA